MRFFEFSITQDAGVDKFIAALRNLNSRADAGKIPAVLKWETVSKLANAYGFEFAADYDTFKSIVDSNPTVKDLVHNFNADGIELKTAKNSTKTSRDPETSQDAIDKKASSAAPKQLKKQLSTPKT